MRHAPIDRARQPPVGPPEEVHHGRHEHGAQHEGVEEDCRRQPDAELGDHPLAAEDEGGEHADHDGGRGGDHAPRRGLPDHDGVAAVVRVHPLLMHAAHEEDLVVHREAEEYGQHDHRQKGLHRPHGKKATTTPNEAPAASRFITAAVAGTSRLRKATSSNRKPRPTMTPMNSGSLALMMAAKSSKIAVLPPTRTRKLLPCSAAGITVLRRCLMRSVVLTSWGAVLGTTGTAATGAFAGVGNGTTAATPGSVRRLCVSRPKAAVSAGEPI